MHKKIIKPINFYPYNFIRNTGTLIWTFWICSCIGGTGGESIKLDVPVKTLPYSIAVLPFEYPRRGKGKTFKKFHPDTFLGQELQRQSFFRDVIFPSLSSSNLRTSSKILNDLTLRGKVTAFQASCTPQSQETETEEPPPLQEEKQDERSQWFKEQKTRGLSSGNEPSPQGWEWGRNKFNELNSSTKDQESAMLQEKSKPFSFELVKYKVHGKLIFTIQILGRLTNKMIYKKTYKGKLDEIVTAFTTTPETVDDYVSRVLLERLLKDFLEDLATDFYQYTQTREFIRKTNLPSPSAMVGNS